MSVCDAYHGSITLFVDKELHGQELDHFVAHLKGCAGCRELLDEEQALSNILRRYRPAYSAPEALRNRVWQIKSSQEPWGSGFVGQFRRRGLQMLQTIIGRGASPAFSWKPITAMVLMTVLALICVPPLIQRARAAEFVDAAVAAHRSYLQGALPLGIQTDSPGGVTDWFAGKVPFQFQLPSQQATEGDHVYRLIGSRVISYKNSYAALVLYKMRSESISLMVAPSSTAVSTGGDVVQAGKLTFHERRVEGLTVITWSNHGLTYALVSPFPGAAGKSCLVCHESMSDHQNFDRQP